MKSKNLITKIHFL